MANEFKKPIPRRDEPESDRPSRESGVVSRDEMPTPVRVERGLREHRKRAVTMRNQGWNWELQGRAAAFRESADQVRKWLLDRDGPVTEQDVRFVVQLLEQSAEVYEAADSAKKSQK